jgi:hypothetical protein
VLVDDARHGFINNLLDGVRKGASQLNHRIVPCANAFVCIAGVVEPFNLWQREIEKHGEYIQVHLNTRSFQHSGLVQDFKDVRLKFDHYKTKVQQLSQRMASEFGRNEKTIEKYNRNAMKLQEATKEYKDTSEFVCTQLVTLLRKRFDTLNPIFIRFVQFHNLYHTYWSILGTAFPSIGNKFMMLLVSTRNGSSEHVQRGGFKCGTHGYRQVPSYDKC